MGSNMFAGYRLWDATSYEEFLSTDGMMHCGGGVASLSVDPFPMVAGLFEVANSMILARPPNTTAAGPLSASGRPSKQR